MPRRLERVPNAWGPYMHGIWEFTFEEFQRMPTWVGINDETGVPNGPRMWTLTQGGLIYVQFSTDGIEDWNTFWGLKNG